MSRILAAVSACLFEVAIAETGGLCLLSRRSATSRLGAATPLCTTSCADGCFAIPYNSQVATDEHCAPCATGQSWWPCNIENLCSCGQVVAETCAKSSDAPSWASWTDSDCLKCGVAINSQLWPCNQVNACTCIGQGSDLVTGVSTSEGPETVVPDPTAGAPTTQAPKTTVPDSPAGTLQLDAWEVPTSESGQIATLNTHNGGYDLPNVNTCFHDKYSDLVKEGDANWVSIESWKAFGMRQPVTKTVPERVPLDGTSVTSRDVNVATLSVSEGGVEKTIRAAIGFGHGVANLKCGDCFIVKTSGTKLTAGSWIFRDENFEELIAYDKETRYAVIRTVDIATWSLEISDPALYYSIPLTGRIDHTTTPDYQPVDCAAVIGAAQG